MGEIKNVGYYCICYWQDGLFPSKTVSTATLLVAKFVFVIFVPSWWKIADVTKDTLPAGLDLIG